MAVITPTRVDGVRRSTITWANVTTADTGALIDVSDLEDVKCLHNVGLGSPQMSASNTGANPFALGSALTANSISNQTLGCSFLGISAVATNTVTVTVTAKRIAR